MDVTSLNNGSALSQYAANLLAKQKTAGGGTGTGDALTARLAAAPADFRTASAQHKLDQQQAALGKELAAGLARTGGKLAGAVKLTAAKDGGIAVDGSDADKAALAKVFKADTSSPRLAARLASTLQAAQSLSASAQQRNAISLAARYGGPSANVMSMYTQFMGHADATPAAISFSGSASTLHYPGALDSRA
jgi:hypothetical protein